MASTITAGNATNGLAMSSDSTGILNVKTGTGSGTIAMTIDASQAVTIPNTLAVTSNQTVGGNLTVTGTITGTGGVSGGIRSGTAVASTSGTSIDFTSIPAGVKRITVMFNGVSTNGASNYQVQIGSGSFITTGYLSFSSYQGSSNVVGNGYSTTGLVISAAAGSANSIIGTMVLTNITGNTWISNHTFGLNPAGAVGYSISGGGNLALGGTLDRVRITTVNGTDTFDAGSINILYE